MCLMVTTQSSEGGYNVYDVVGLNIYMEGGISVRLACESAGD